MATTFMKFIYILKILNFSEKFGEVKVDSFLNLQLHHILHSSFLIQMIRWIRVSLRVESFVFLITWGIFFGWWELDLQLLPSSFLLLWVELLLVCALPKVAGSNHFLLAHIPQMNESHDPGRPFKVVITISAFSTSSSTATSCSLIRYTLVKYDCMVSALWIFTFFN